MHCQRKLKNAESVFCSRWTNVQPTLLKTRPPPPVKQQARLVAERPPCQNPKVVISNDATTAVDAKRWGQRRDHPRWWAALLFIDGGCCWYLYSRDGVSGWVGVGGSARHTVAKNSATLRLLWPPAEQTRESRRRRTPETRLPFTCFMPPANSQQNVWKLYLTPPPALNAPVVVIPLPSFFPSLWAATFSGTIGGGGWNGRDWIHCIFVQLLPLCK